MSRISLGWLLLIIMQAGLGAATVWSNKAADIATAHMLAGAVSLATGSFLCLLSWRGVAASKFVRATGQPHGLPGLTYPTATAGLE